MADPNPESWSNKYGDFTRPHYETKEAYLAKGKEIYEWAVKNLVDSNTGEVADSKHGEGNPAWSDHVYNQATLSELRYCFIKLPVRKHIWTMQFWELTIQ